MISKKGAGRKQNERMCLQGKRWGTCLSCERFFMGGKVAIRLENIFSGDHERFPADAAWLSLSCLASAWRERRLGSPRKMGRWPPDRNREFKVITGLTDTAEKTAWDRKESQMEKQMAESCGTRMWASPCREERLRFDGGADLLGVV